MSRYHFNLQSTTRLYSLLLLLLMAPLTLMAQTTDSGYQQTAAIDSLVNIKYQERVDKMHKKWMSLIPNIGVWQYAGNIGFVSLGIGWDYGKHDRWETHMMFGYLPAFVMSDDMITFTIRESLNPWRIHCSDLFSVNPCAFNFGVNTVLNHEFWISETARYGGGGYYRFSSKVRFQLGIGSRVNLHIPMKRRRHADTVTLYYDLSTYDLALVSAFSNHHHRYKDLVALGFGLQYKFF